MTITTTNSHVNRAVDFFNKSATYFALGKSSAWLDDAIPPAPDVSLTSLEELIGFKKVEISYLVARDDVNGTIVYRDSKWRIVPADQAVAQGAKWVYVETTIRYDELPLGEYRQVGVYTGLTLQAATPAGKFNLLPSEVLSYGVLEVVDNRKSSNRQADQKEKLSLVIEF